MFGSRNNDEKEAKRHNWPWGRRDELDQGKDAAPSSEALTDNPGIEDNPKQEQSITDAAQTHTDTASAKEKKEPKVGLFARMRQKFEKTSTPAETDSATPDNDLSDSQAAEPPATDSSTLADTATNETSAQINQAPNTAQGLDKNRKDQPQTATALTPAQANPQDIAQQRSQHSDNTPVPDTTSQPAPTDTEVTSGGFFSRMRKGLSKTRNVLVDGVTELFIGKKEIDDELLEELETQLLIADVGVEATSEIMARLTERIKYRELDDADALIAALKAELRAILEPADQPLVIPEQKKPYVILIVGVNGVGKTTTIGKLASRLKQQNKSVMLAAGDTFRAAAVEQLQVWGQRNAVPVVAQHTGADSASVIYDAFEAAQARRADVLIADTAGRLHNKEHLMEELKKVKRVLAKLDIEAPHEVLLVMDAGTGQNALSQAKLFHESVGLTGMALTKLDGTAKGGVIFALSRQMQLPIRFLGVGEQMEDLRPFAADEFVDALFNYEG